MFIFPVLIALNLLQRGTGLTKTACAPASATVNDCNGKLIDIASASFMEVTTCSPSPVATTPSCMLSNAVDVVKMACQNREKCTVVASNVTFGTSCTGTMYLDISYSCVSVLTSQPRPVPGKVTKSTANINWQKNPSAGSNGIYRLQRRAVPLSQPTAVSGLLFEGYGYLAFDSSPFDGGKKFKIKLSFRTLSADGLIMLAFKSDWKSYVYLELTNGQLSFSVQGDKGNPVTFTTTDKWNDGRFHAVEAEKKGKKSGGVKLTIDGNVIGEKKNTNKDEVDASVDFVYLGWAKQNGLLKLASKAPSTKRKGFIGCLDVEELQSGKKFELSKNLSYTNVRWESNGCPPAVENGMHFRGAGYVKLTLSSSSESEIQLSFRMKTNWPNGLLVAAYDNDYSSFLFLETRIDGIDLRYKKGTGASDGPFISRFRTQTISICDGTWHTIKLAMNSSAVEMAIDDKTFTDWSGLTDVPTFSSNILKNVYVGGIARSSSFPSAEQTALSYGVNVSDYGGCLGNLTVNSQVIDVTENRSDSQNVSFAGCPDFPGNSPSCQDQLVNVRTTTKDTVSYTDSGVSAFTEYLYRVLAQKTSSSGVVSSEWAIIRTGEDGWRLNLSLPAPEADYDGVGKVTIKWRIELPAAIVTAYEVAIYNVYPGTTIPQRGLKPVKNSTSHLPHILSAAPSSLYNFTVKATTSKGSVASSYVVLATTGRECYHTYHSGTYYRGTTESVEGSPCLNWSSVSVYSNLLALYPEAGLGNHSYCRTPIAENRTRPWCYTHDHGGCLTWSYCNVKACEDVSCYSLIDRGFAYRGTVAKTSKNNNCTSWNQYTDYPVSQYGNAGLGNHSECRNPDPEKKKKPWCYKPDGKEGDCSVVECKDVPSVSFICGGTSGSDETSCVFPFVYKGKRFVECTTYDEGIPWCSTKNDDQQKMNKWSYCLCPKPSVTAAPPPVYSPPTKGSVDGVCPLPPLPTTVSITTLNPTTARTVSSTTAISRTTTKLPPSSKTVTTTVHPSTQNIGTTMTSKVTGVATSPVLETSSSEIKTTSANSKQSAAATSASGTPRSTVTSSTSSSKVTGMTTSDSQTQSTATTSSTGTRQTAASPNSPSGSQVAATSKLPTSSGSFVPSTGPTTVKVIANSSVTSPTTSHPLTDQSSSAITLTSRPTARVTPRPITTQTAGVASPSPSSSVIPSSGHQPQATSTEMSSTSPAVTVGSTTSTDASEQTSQPTSSQTLSPTTAESEASKTEEASLGSSTGSSSAMFIGIGAGVACLVAVTAVVLSVVFCRRTKRKFDEKYGLEAEELEMTLRRPGMKSREEDPCYAAVSPFLDQKGSSFGFQDDYMDPVEMDTQNGDDYNDPEGMDARKGDDYNDPAGMDARNKDAGYQKAQNYLQPTATALIVKSKDATLTNAQYEAPVQAPPSQAQLRDILRTTRSSKEEIYWEPAKTEEKLYGQLSGGHILEKSALELEKVLGTGEFGTVEKGVWHKDDSTSFVVAVKTLKSDSKENRVKFLREAAIMGQFKHRNVIVMHGVVLSGNPLMVVLEILPKGDLKQYLQSIAAKDEMPSNLDVSLLKMARDIAAGMSYLARLSFIHRDLAARNVLLDSNLVCKIADFGLSRDLADESYYVTHGGAIPIRWTAPEAINYRKYSTASDVWSFGIVLYEIWTVGKRPYGASKNAAVMDKLDSGYRLPAPPGCSRPLYKLMIDCWHPDHHRRPNFNRIATHLSEPERDLLSNGGDAEPISGKLGDFEVAQSSYRDLQMVYCSPAD
eukprot:m.272060 g.272060  ORF g.272060 m.272060 type:complete len:1760 (+) comp40559_c1_seq3:144-5423(+)